MASSFMLQNDILRMHRNKFRMPNKNGVVDSLDREEMVRLVRYFGRCGVLLEPSKIPLVS